MAGLIKRIIRDTGGLLPAHPELVEMAFCIMRARDEQNTERKEASAATGALKHISIAFAFPTPSFIDYAKSVVDKHVVGDRRVFLGLVITMFHRFCRPNVQLLTRMTMKNIAIIFAPNVFPEGFISPPATVFLGRHYSSAHVSIGIPHQKL